MLNEIKSILITGGTGSFGKAFLKQAFKKLPNLKRLIVFSRDELKQWELSQKYPQEKYPAIRFFLGDVRDKERLHLALEDVDCVIHAAALKQVPAAEYNPGEFIKTNIFGAENLIHGCLERKVKKIIALSTDKASSPVNLYGATKLCSDKLFIASNNIRGAKDTSFSIVRYGNVMGSRGSVIPYFLNIANQGFLPITDDKMTRFNITLDESVEMVFWALENSIGGEIYVPKIPSYRIQDLAKAIGPNCKIKKLGARPGEKYCEEMISVSDAPYTYELNEYYVIVPNGYDLNKSKIKNQIKNKVDSNFSYNSSNNKTFLSVEEIRKLILENVDPTFKPI